MKSINQKILGLTALMIFGANNTWAANESAGIAMSDTMLFSLFLFSAIVLLMIIFAQVSAMKGMLENKDLWNKKGGKTSNGKSAKAGLLIGALILGNQTFAQGTEAAPLIVMTEELYWIMIGLNGLLLGIVISLYYVLRGLISTIRGVEEEMDVVSSITAGLTDAIPLDKEQEILLDHDYDGIRELDNNLPPWWKYGFYFTIVFAFIYLIIYHVTGTGDLQTEEYEKEMAQAEIEIEAYMATKENPVDETNLIALEDATSLESGKAVFVGNCLVCHGANGEGIVGPNLTDEYWKNGGGIKNVYKTIKTGIPEKGMISWEPILTPGQMLEVASYILTLQGTNPPNGKPAEGEIWKEEAAAPIEESKPEGVTEEVTEEVSE